MRDEDNASRVRTDRSGSVGEILVEAETGVLAAGWISSDTVSLLSGVDSAQAGGVSSLPMMHGLGDDRIRSLVNGVPVAAACPMRMNPPLSYIDPSDVARIEVLPGVTPVRLGGDSIAGSIGIESAPPAFAATDDAIEFHAVDRKTDVDPLRLDFAVSNLLNRQYASPLGGTWQSAQYSPGYAGATFRPLPAPGRSIDTGFSVSF